MTNLSNLLKNLLLGNIGDPDSTKELITVLENSGGLPSPVEAITNYTGFEAGGPASFVGVDSDADQTHHKVVYGSTDTNIDSNHTSDVWIVAGDNRAVTPATTAPGKVFISGGNAQTTGSAVRGGDIALFAGSSDTGTGGDVIFGTGFGSTADGNIILNSEQFGGGGGHIRFFDGTQGTIGQVWTSIDTNGTGSWTAPNLSPIKQVSGTYNLSLTLDRTVMFNTAVAGPHIANLPAGVNGREFIIKDSGQNATINNITITPNAGAGDAVDAGVTPINSDGGARHLQFWSGTWWLVGSV